MTLIDCDGTASMLGLDFTGQVGMHRARSILSAYNIYGARQLFPNPSVPVPVTLFVLRSLLLTPESQPCFSHVRILIRNNPLLMRSLSIVCPFHLRRISRPPV